MSVARFRVSFARPLDGALGATVTIDRARLLFSVRLLRRRREFTLPLAHVAESMVWTILRAETAAKIRDRREARRARSKERRR